MNIKLQTGKAKVIIKDKPAQTKLQRLRLAKGASVELVHRDLNNMGFKCSLGSLMRWESGKSLKLDTALALASYYGVRIDEIIG
jgi:transcriptional regulator with XRE-family HTH domain